MLSLKYSDTKPKNPNRAIRQFFGKYYDPKIEMQKSLREEILLLETEQMKLRDRVLDLEQSVEVSKKRYKIKKVYSMYELDSKTGLLSTKVIIEKLTGNKKFEVDEKLSFEDFYKLLDNICEGRVNVIELVANNLKVSTEGVMIYKDDLENPVYKRLVQAMLEMKKSNKK